MSRLYALLRRSYSDQIRTISFRMGKPGSGVRAFQSFLLRQ